MGLFALANRAVEAKATRPDGTAVAQAAPGAGGDGSEPPASVTSALQVLVEFIPTETITLYWLAVPASKNLWDWMHPGTKVTAATSYDWGMYWGLVALTPLLLMLAYFSSLATRALPWTGPGSWPWWKAFAATLAFAVWAFAVPGNPFITASPVLMAVWVGATLLSIVLAQLDPIVARLTGGS